MFKLGVPLLFLSLMLEENIGERIGVTPQTSMILSIIIFLSAIIALYRVKSVSENSLNEINYSDEYKSKLLIKYMYYWLAIALSIDVIFAVLLESQFWSNINPFDSSIVFLILFFISVFSSSLKIEFLVSKCQLKCSRLGFITSNISNFKDLKLNENELVIISQDNGKYTFRLGRFTVPMRDLLISTCLNMPNKKLNKD